MDKCGNRRGSGPWPGPKYIVYTTISIIGAWQVFANVGITFERMNIFTCGKKQMVAWIKAVTGGGLGPGQGPNQSQNRKGCKADPLLKSQGSRHSRLYNSCSFSACRWTTVPSHLVIGLLDWLQWWTKVAISSEKRENFEIFLCPRWIFFSKKIFKNILKVVFYTF